MTEVSRRTLLTGISALGLGAGLGWRFASADAPGWTPGKPADRWRHLVRMQMSTRAEDVLWWYTGRIYAQVGEDAPRHLFNLEGTEIYWPRPLPDGSFSVSGRTLTFLRDKQSGEMLREYKNPYTDERVTVLPNRLGSKDGALFSEAGFRLLHAGSDPAPWMIEWHRSGNQVWLTSSRDMDFLPQPWLESMTVFCPFESFEDARVAKLPAQFSSTFLSPWLGWMKMGERPGHLVWHSSGRKLDSAEEIPNEYRRRVDEEHGGVLTAAPDSWQ